MRSFRLLRWSEDGWPLGVALHDRGYPARDTHPLGEVRDREWLETQSRGVEMRHTDPIVALIALARVRYRFSF
jgi:hypothetical protein